MGRCIEEVKDWVIDLRERLGADGISLVIDGYVSYDAWFQTTQYEKGTIIFFLPSAATKLPEERAMTATVCG